MSDGKVGETACIESWTSPTEAVVDRIVLSEHDEAARRPHDCSQTNTRRRLTQHNTHLHDASRSRVPGVPFGMVTVALSSHGLQTTSILDEGSAAALVQSQLAQCTNVTGMPEPLARNCTEGVARDDSRRINVAISASGSNGQHEFSNTRPSKQLSLPLQEPYFTTLIFNFAHFQGL